MGVIKHEVTHILLEPLLERPEAEDYVGRLNWIVMNEGIAHFIGYPGDRREIHEKHAGPIWEKYGAMSGMLRAAAVYRQQGSRRLIHAIRAQSLPCQAD